MLNLQEQISNDIVFLTLAVLSFGSLGIFLLLKWAVSKKKNN